ncbi:hypothetical protein [Leptothoe spongobia]|uniref:Uncharacterized protein n=1 Tax=Leptothoe spongobia TAU-MAC 1115 TaxID=1967444 RepID=A0A947DFW4_9CYAN|nr:hypothetical protein [Leptothoe spongobia]MBT9316298.1 hypothetical protein [Leptothoe spongobia TAU-MAC 1115]
MNLGFPSQQELIVEAIRAQLLNPLLAVDVEHWVACHVDSENFEEGQYPNYLGDDPGEFQTGVRYEISEHSPLRGVICEAKFNPWQAIAGIRYQAENRLYLPDHPGEIFKLHDSLPKLQDKFIIRGHTHYAMGPATPCHSGEVVAMWQVDLASQRIPVEDHGYQDY